MNSDPINVLFMQHDASDMGGVTKVLLDLLTTLHPNLIQATVILPESGALEEVLTKLEVEYVIVPSVFFPGRNLNGAFNYVHQLSQRAEVIKKIIIDKKIDIVHTHTIFPFEAAIAALKTNTPHIWHIHNNFFYDTAPVLFYGLDISHSTIAKIYGILSDLIIPVSQDAATFFLENNISTKTQVIHNGINILSFDKNASYNRSTNLFYELKIPVNSRLIATICRVTPQKNILLFIKAAKLILESEKDTHFLIIGPTNTLNRNEYFLELKAFIDENDLTKNIHFIGERADVPSLLKHCINICIISSDFEGLPIIGLETLASKTPLISTRCGGTIELIEQGDSGFLVDKNDAEGIAKYAVALLKDGDLACKIGEAGRQRVIDHFTIETFAENFYAAYQQVIKQHDPLKQADRLAVVESFLSLLSHNAALHEKLKLIDSRLKILEQSSDRITNNFIYRLIKKIYLFLTRQSTY